MDHDLLTGKYVGPVGPLVISGQIDPGDYERLVSKILDDENRFLSQNKIIVASTGGDVGEAIKIALFVRALYSEVTVGPQTGPCIAACFLIYAAADRRATDGERLLGLHRPALIEGLSNSLPPGQAAALEDRALSQVRAFLAANDVPDDLMEEMFRRSPHEVYWLSERDEQRLGFESHAFLQYLRTRCTWEEALQENVYAGKRPFSDLAQAMACRDRAIQAEARKTLDLARKARSVRGAAEPDKSKKR